MNKIPKDTQIRDVIDKIPNDDIRMDLRGLSGILNRFKILQKYKVFGDKYLILLDGVNYYSSNKCRCEHCLLKKKDGKETYSHAALQALLVKPGKGIIFPIDAEEISNKDGSKKQDCEINAAKRLIERISREHCRMDMIIVADSLYSKEPFIKTLQEKNKQGKIVKNAWITNLKPTRKNIEQMVKCGRSRWKIESRKLML